MADTKLTREWVEEHLRFREEASVIGDCTVDSLIAALCRHYLATEQDARDAIELLERAKIVCHESAMEGKYASHNAALMTNAIDSFLQKRAIDAALTQKETP